MYSTLDSLFNSRVSKKPLLTFSDSEISVLIECLVSDTIKYEYNKKCELVFPDSVNGMPRVLNCPYPCNYGFSENFVSQDGDYLDAFVFAKEKPNRGENIICMPRFIILMTDNGEEDSKLICSRDSMSLKIEEVKGFLQNYSIDNIQIDHIIDLRCKPLDYGSLIKRYQINLKHPASVDMFNTSYVFGEF